jgi:hypothetical protein
MNSRRTCIICLPRSGSQLCERLAAEATSARILGEYFENWNQSEYALTLDNRMYLKKFVQQPAELMIRENFKESLALLKQTKTDQPLTIRLFLMDHYDKNTLLSIVTDLKSIGFEFLVLNRNIREQLLSYMIALAYHISKNKMVFAINNVIDETVSVDIPSLTHVLDKVVISFKNWENNLSTVLKDTEYQKISYENIYQDMETAFDTKFRYSGKKSINGDPLDLILNKEEVLSFLSSRLEGIN